MSTPTITPTITPAPKPEWPEITAYVYHDTEDGEIFVTTDNFENSYTGRLATVTIPSSAECERRAKVEAARENVIEAAKAVCVYDYASTEKIKNAIAQLRKLEQENQP